MLQSYTRSSNRHAQTQMCVAEATGIAQPPRLAVRPKLRTSSRLAERVGGRNSPVSWQAIAVEAHTARRPRHCRRVVPAHGSQSGRGREAPGREGTRESTIPWSWPRARRAHHHATTGRAPAGGGAQELHSRRDRRVHRHRRKASFCPGGAGRKTWLAGARVVRGGGGAYGGCSATPARGAERGARLPDTATSCRHKRQTSCDEVLDTRTEFTHFERRHACSCAPRWHHTPRGDILHETIWRVAKGPLADAGERA